MMMFLKIVVVMAMLSVAMSKFSIPSPLRVPSVGRSNSPPERRDLSSVELCTTETCGFDASAFDRAAVLKRSYSAGDPDIVFYWSFVGDDKIRIGVDANNVNGWFSIGMSANGGMMGADVWRLMKDSAGHLKLDDMFVEDWVTPSLDTVQNVKLLTAQQTSAGRTSFTFERKLVTCDGGANRVNYHLGNQDFDIRAHEVGNLIYAWGNDHSNFMYHGSTQRGYAAGFAFGDASHDFGSALIDEEDRDGADVLNGTTNSSSSPGSEYNDTIDVNLVNDAYTIDHTRSTILVHTHWNAPNGSWVILNIQRVGEPSLSRYHHHTLFYGCSEAVSNHSDPLEERGEGVCNEILAVSPGFGLAVGDGSNILSFRVEVHYDGLTPMTQDTVDPGVGYIITLAPNDGRVEEMGVMTTGSIALSMNGMTERTSESNHLWGECVIPDTVPSEGVTVLYNFFHMHLKGRGMYVSHIRNGVELEPLGRQNYYDWWYQGTSGSPNEVGRKLLPGDRLITHCYYDTTNSLSWHDRGGTAVQNSNEIFGLGEGTDDEMCFNFIAYYPRHNDLKLCIGATMGVGDPTESFDQDRRNLREFSSQDMEIHRILSSANIFSELLNGMMATRERRDLTTQPAPACASSTNTMELRGCFDTTVDVRCASGTIQRLCQIASGCYANNLMCTDSGTLTSWVHWYQNGACVPAFTYCAPCYPHSPCGGDFHFDLLELDPYTPYSVATPSSDVQCLMGEEAAESSSSGMSGGMIGGIIAAVVAVVVVIAIAFAVVRHQQPGASCRSGNADMEMHNRPTTPPKTIVPVQL